MMTRLTALAAMASALLSASIVQADSTGRHPAPPVRPAEFAAASQATPPVAEPPSLVRFLTALTRPQPVAPPLAPSVAALPEETPTPPSRPARRQEPGAGLYQPLIAKHAAAHGIPAALADAMVRIESRYDTNARNGPNLGLTQINFRTAQSIGYTGTASGLFDADTNLRFGIKYLAQAYRLAGGDMCRTVLKYQAGHRAVTMTRAASAYCARVQSFMAAKAASAQ